MKTLSIISILFLVNFKSFSYDTTKNVITIDSSIVKDNYIIAFLEERKQVIDKAKLDGNDSTYMYEYAKELEAFCENNNIKLHILCEKYDFYFMYDSTKYYTHYKYIKNMYFYNYCSYLIKLDYIKQKNYEYVYFNKYNNQIIYENILSKTKKEFYINKYKPTTKDIKKYIKNDTININKSYNRIVNDNVWVYYVYVFDKNEYKNKNIDIIQAEKQIHDKPIKIDKNKVYMIVDSSIDYFDTISVYIIK